MQKVEPNEYNFMPNTWVLPQEYGYFQSYAKKLYRQGANTCFIQKPANGAMGHGDINPSSTHKNKSDPYKPTIENNNNTNNRSNQVIP
ncbi:unnamed protein product [Trichobilharzia regenti]|nr:unnamed protein product [Trichobilharzia regenti]